MMAISRWPAASTWRMMARAPPSSSTFTAGAPSIGSLSTVTYGTPRRRSTTIVDLNSSSPSVRKPSTAALSMARRMLPSTGGASISDSLARVQISPTPSRKAGRNGLRKTSGSGCGTRTPIAPVRPVLMLRATGFGTNPSSSAMARIFLAVASDRRLGLLKAKETAVFETPARRAISEIVTLAMGACPLL